MSSIRVTIGAFFATLALTSCATAKTPRSVPVAKAPATPSAAVPASAPQPTPSASPSSSPGDSRALLPLPVSLQWTESAGFFVNPSTVIVVPAGNTQALFVGRFLADLLTTVGSSGPAVIEASASAPVRDAAIILQIDQTLTAAGVEGYTLTVTPRGVTIAAPAPAGLFFGVQTLRQLVPPFLEHRAARPKPILIPAVEISDAPRFEWRGAMLDVARHFFGVSEVKRFIDLLALHKLNRLHLHLSDDQGWRIEIKSWPNLTAVGGRTQVGGGRAGFYTQAEYAEIVAYARERFIDVVPEIDMPGHTNAALASYAELNCDKVAPPLYTDIKVGFSSFCVADERTHALVNDVIREIAALTPGPYFHVGGDEVKTLSTADYERFINRAQETVLRHGKRMIGWDEVTTAALSPTSVVQHWRPGTKLGETASKGVRIIMSPANRAYLDMQYDPATPLGLFWAGRIEVRDAYGFDPATLIEGVSETSVLGVEAPLWSETLATMSDVESMAFPRLAAIAEIGWTPQALRDWEGFRVRLGGQAARWQALGINFYRSPQIPWRP